MLVRTPAPYDRESLMGYILRLSESNGYDTPWHLLKYAGVTPEEIYSACFPVKKLAEITGVSLSKLQAIAYGYRESSTKVQYVIQGHSLTSSLSFNPLRLRVSSFCPYCVAEQGYVDSFFDLKAVVACPTHGCNVLNHCPSCHQRLSWLRPGLLTCRCGASLATTSLPLVSPELVSLLKLLQAKFYGKELPHNECNFPAKHLLSMSLRTLLLKLPYFAKFNKPTAGNDQQILLEGAIEVLANWPHGFHRFLREIEEQATQGISYKKRFEEFYNLLFSSSLDDVRWLRDEFVRYGVELASNSIVDDKLLQGQVVTRRYVTKAELARHLGLSQTTLRKWVEKSMIDMRVIQTRKNVRYVADITSPDFAPPVVTKENKGNVFKMREAAAYLGVPETLLIHLKQRDLLPSAYRHKLKGGFHQGDLDAFREQLLQVSPRITALPVGELVNFQQVLAEYRFHDDQGKVCFVVDYLTGKILSLGRTGNTLSDIQFNRQLIVAYVATCRAIAAGGSLTSSEAAKLIGCEQSPIPNLITQGFLTSTDGKESSRITKESIDCFVEQYVPLSQIAREHASSSRYLIKLCEKLSIALLQVARTGKNSPAFFVERKYREDLVELLTDRPLKPRKPINAPRITRGEKLFANYLADLSATNTSLPFNTQGINLRAMAAACGFERSTFYKNKGVKAMLEDYLARNSRNLQLMG